LNRRRIIDAINIKYNIEVSHGRIWRLRYVFGFLLGFIPACKATGKVATWKKAVKCPQCCCIQCIV